MTAAVVALVYLVGFLTCARMLFCRLRPSRAPLCEGTHYDSYGYQKRSHAAGCYRRRRKDLTSVGIDKDVDAMLWSALASVAWPAVFTGMLLMSRPPELPEEQAQRIRELEKQVADMEKEAGLE